jgi:mono/diheme cytochrome c family protein
MRIAAGLVFFVAVIVYAQESASMWDGVFVKEQVSRGKALFGQQCVSCHQETLSGKVGTAPPLSGPQFKENWNGLTADDLFEYIVKSMPRGQAARLSREQTADVLSFVLSFNGFPDGKKELPIDAAALKTIRFEAAKPTLEAAKPK